MTPTDRARVLLELVEDCLRSGKRELAIEQLDKALREERESLAAWCDEMHAMRLKQREAQRAPVARQAFLAAADAYAHAAEQAREPLDL